MTKAKAKSKRDGASFLRDAFASEQKLLQVQLDLSRQSITHPGVLGEVDEQHFIETLRKYLPKRYAVETGIVIDSRGATSDQIDVIIYDNQYSPTMLDQMNHRFIPAEAVYAVLEVKQVVNSANLDYAGKKAESVRSLHRTSVPIAHAGGQYDAKKIFDIIAGIVAGRVVWKDGFSSRVIRNHCSSANQLQRLDCGLAVSGYCFDLYNEFKEIGPSENALTYFLFRLLQKLQSLGTAPAIDWEAYAKAVGGKTE